MRLFQNNEIKKTELEHIIRCYLKVPLSLSRVEMLKGLNAFLIPKIKFSIHLLRAILHHLGSWLLFT